MANDENANVVLTADTSGYTQGIQAATVQTNNLIAAVDTLSGKLSNLTKSVGRKLVLFSAADTAAMAGMVKLASNFEDQMQTLTATTKVTNQSIESYRRGINQLSRDLPVARGELAALATQLQSSGVQGQKASESMSRTFVMLAKTTGSSISEISQGMVDLSRQMGTLGSGGTQMGRFADSLTSIATQSGVSATNVLSFANAIAPASRAAGIGQAQVLGLATAFSKAGADGYAAANTFNGMLNDITRSVSNGSPDLAKYANLIGVTTSQFKSMDQTDAITRIFESINRQGPKAIDTLDRMGIDGVRALKSIQAVTQSGDLRNSVAVAVNGAGSDSTNKAFSGSATLSDEMQKIGNSVQVLATNIGETLLPAATAVAGAFGSMLSTVVAMTQPLQHLAGLVGALGAPVAAAGGVALQSMSMLSTAAMAAYAFRGRGVQAFRSGFKGGQEGVGFSGGMGWANPVGRFAAGMGAYMPAEPGTSGLSKIAALPFRAASALMRGSTAMYLDSMHMGTDRPHLFGSSSNGGTSLYRDARNAGESMTGAFRTAWAGSEALGKAAQNAAADLVKLGVATTRAGASAIWQGGAGVLKAGAGAIGKVAGALGPVGLGMIGIEGLSAWRSSIQDRQQGDNPDTSTFNPLTMYNTALGVATTATRDFTTALNKATTQTYDSVKAAYTIGNSQTNYAAQNQYTNPMVAGLSDSTLVGSAFVRSLNVQNPQTAGLVASDVIKRYGANAQTVLNGAMPSDTTGVNASRGMNTIGDVGTRVMGARQANGNSNFWDYLKGGGLSSDASGQYENIQGAINQKVQEVQGKSGDKAAMQTKVAMAQEMWNNISVRGPVDFGGRAQKQKAIGLLEKNVFGGQINYGPTDYNLTWEELVKKASETDATKGTIKSWNDMGLSTGATAGAAALNDQKSMISATQVGINSTKLGRFTNTNNAVLAAVATPSDLSATRAGAVALSSAALGGMPNLGGKGDMTKSLVGANTSLEQLKAAIQNANDPLYQLAQAAQSVIGVFQSMRSLGQGRFTNMGQSYQSASKALGVPNLSEDDKTKYQQQIAGTYQEADSYFNSLIMANKQYQLSIKRSNEDFATSEGNARADFHKSQVRQEQDFGLQLSRAAEDAAKSIYDPFKRVYSTYTESSASTLENLGDQNKRIIQQKANLDRLKRMGVSQGTISTLDLSNPANAQQVQRMVEDLANNPALVKAINSSIATRLRATKALTQSSYSDTFTRQIADFKRGSDRQLTDFNTSMTRMDAARNRELARAAEDLSLFGQEVTGSLGEKAKTAISMIGNNIGKVGTAMTKEIKKFMADNPGLFDPNIWAVINGQSAPTHDEHPSGNTSSTGQTAGGSASSRSSGSSSGHAPPIHTTGVTVPRGVPTPRAAPTTSSYDSSTNFWNSQFTVVASDPAKLSKSLADMSRLRKLASGRYT